MSTTENENQTELSQAGNESDPPQPPDDNDLSAELTAADMPVETAAAADDAADDALDDAANDAADDPANEEIEVLPGGESSAMMDETADSLSAGDSPDDELVGLDDADLDETADSLSAGDNQDDEIVGLDEADLDETADSLSSEDSPEDEFVGLDDADLDDPVLEASIAKPAIDDAEKSDSEAVADNSEEAAPAETDEGAGSEEQSLHKQSTGKKAKSNESKNRAAGWSILNKLVSAALVAVVAAAFYLYHNPSLIGFTKAGSPVTPVVVQPVAVAPPIQQPVTRPKVPSKVDTCTAKVEEALRLRNELLEKNQEIFELDAHYRSGIDELEAEARQELRQLGLKTFDQALENKRIELKLLTIQRRQAYIHGLIKPAYWLNKGSEELFYLARRAQLDLQMTEIAAGIDLNKHIRHINAAIQKFLPNTEKLAVDPDMSQAQPLEQIWQQVSRKEKTGRNKKKIGLLTLDPKDKLLINQVCTGNFDHIAELTKITSRGASCLARMKGTELILNSLETLSPDAGQQLFKWQGNWICLNRIKALSPGAAHYLFKWKGDWISLNGLADFPPELAKHLLNWDGRQLELMGIEPEKGPAGQKTLKYLALWEATGGKLFVTDQMRQAINKLQ